MKPADKIRYFSHLTLMAFLLNVMLPFFAVYNPSQLMASETKPSPNKIASVLGEKRLLCTSHGLKWVSVEALQEGHHQTDSHPQYQCPLCYVANQDSSHGILTSTVKYNYRYNIYYLSPHFFEVVSLSPANKSDFWTRAPPNIT